MELSFAYLRPDSLTLHLLSEALNSISIPHEVCPRVHLKATKYLIFETLDIFIEVGLNFIFQAGDGQFTEYTQSLSTVLRAA